MLLSDREKKFITHYIETMNGKESAKYAGYRAKDDRALTLKASQLLKKKSIAIAINEKMRNYKNISVIADKDEVLKFLTKVIRGGESNTKVIVMDGDKQTIINHKFDCSVDEKLKACEIMVGLLWQ